MDMLMVAGSLLSIFLSVLVFLSPESSPVFFSLIFILSGFVAYGTGTKKLKRKRDFREMLWGVFFADACRIFVCDDHIEYPDFIRGGKHVKRRGA